jgi:dynein heavy chain
MVGLVGSQCWWTWEVEDAFHKVKAGNKHGMKQLMARLTEQMAELVAEIRKPDISSNARKKINTLIIIDVHGKDIVDRFVRDSILDEREFAWESQLRFYWDRVKDDVVIRQCTGQFRYGYEFMGLNGRLVITPLTDRCYMTLTQALTFQMGGAPAGPAGTGKTETVKDLAKCLANPCFVTNCGEGLDYRAMGAIFSGLVQSGAWYALCVNQLWRSILSNHAMYILCVRVFVIDIHHYLSFQPFFSITGAASTNSIVSIWKFCPSCRLSCSRFNWLCVRRKNVLNLWVRKSN